MMSNQTYRNRMIPVAVAAILVGVDQILKIWMTGLLQEVGRIEVIHGLFYLSYVENRGAAFGIFQGKTGMLVVLTAFLLLAVLFLVVTGKTKNLFLTWSLSLVLAGGVGNLIDRIVRGYVVDYLDFSALFGFPVFNFADCCVVVGTLLILCYIAWSDRSSKSAGHPQAPGDVEGEADA